MTNPWMKFYPTDWRADPRLRMCSLAARGLWIDLMAYMHEGQPYGHLTIDGAVPDVDQIAAIIGRPVAEVSAALTELESRNVFSRAENGAIVSRRMVRDCQRAEIGRREAEKRWAPNRSPNGSPTGLPNAQNPEPESREVREELFVDGEKGKHVHRAPPRHCTVSRKHGTVFIRQGTPDWDTYAADFKEAFGAEPIPNRDGGYWFKIVGETRAPTRRLA